MRWVRFARGLVPGVLLAGTLAGCSGSPAAAVAASAVLPQSPLSAREGAAAAWTGTELVVLGGVAGKGQGEVRTTYDAAAFDPKRQVWRTLPSHSVLHRRGATAVSTPAGVLVWGGIAACRAGKGSCPLPRTGALLDPRAGVWRTVDPGRKVPGLSGAQGVPACGGVVFGGGRDVDGTRSRQVVLAPKKGRWRSVALPSPVFDLTATSLGLAVLGIAPANYEPRVYLLDPCTLKEKGSFPGPVPNVQGGWVEDVGGQLVVAVQSSRGVFIDAITALDRPSKRLDRLQPGVLEVPHSFATTRDGWTQSEGGAVYGGGAHGVWRWDAASHKIVQYRDPRGPCGAGAAAAVTPAGILVWGGQSCTPGAAPQTASGAVFPLRQ